MTSRQSGGSGPLVAMALCMALQMTGLVMLQPLFALRFENLGADVKALGASAMAYALGATIAAPLLGMLADRVGRRPIILASLAAHVVAFSGFLFSKSAGQLIVLRGVVGIFAPGLIAAMTSIVGDLAPATGKGRWIGIVNGGASVGWIAGPLLGGVLQDSFGATLPFASSIALAAVALVVAVAWIPESRAPSTTERLQAGGVRRLGWPQFPGLTMLSLLLIIMFGLMFAWAFIEPLFMFYAYDELLWSSSQLGLVMSAYGAAFMLGEFSLGQLSDRVGRRPVLVLGLALFSAQFLGLALFRDTAPIMVSFIVAGTGNALYDPALNAWILDITPAERTAGVLGLKSTAGSLGSMLGPGLVVLYGSLLPPKAGFLLAAILVIILTLACAWKLHPKERVEAGVPS